MWKCSKCKRSFKTLNQSHTCTLIDMGELFVGKPDDLVLALDKLIVLTADWQPNEVGVAKNAIVFTSKKAWLIVKPMSKLLDIKFYHTDEMEDDCIAKSTYYRNKYAHHIRVSSPDEITPEVIKLLKEGHRFTIH